MSEMDSEHWRDFMNTAVGVPPGRVTVAAVRRRLVRRRMKEVAGVLAVVTAAVVGVTVGVQAVSTSPGAGLAPAGGGRGNPAVYVSYHGEGLESGRVIPISQATHRAGQPLPLKNVGGMAATPDGRTLYVAAGQTVTPVSTATGKLGKPIRISISGDPAYEIAMDPDGKTAYAIAGFLDQGIEPINTVTNTAGKPIHITLSSNPAAIVFSPDGKTLYVGTNGGTVTPINTVTNKPGKPIQIGISPIDLAITPDGKTLYVLSPSMIAPVNIASGTAGKRIRLPRGGCCFAAVTPDGKTVYVDSNGVIIPISTATNQAGQQLHAGFPDDEIVFTPDGKTAYVSYYSMRTDGTIIPVSTASNTAGKPVRIGHGPITIAVTPDGKTVYAATRTQVVPVSTATNTPGKPIPIHVGGPLNEVSPLQVVITS